MTRRSKTGLASQPAMLGAIAIFVTIVAVYFVYNADSGLPYVPTYDVRAELPNAEHLGKTGDVRMAGLLVGRVGERRLVRDPDGSAHAVLELRLYKEIEPLPADSRVAMRAVSSLGSSYVELVPGESKQPLRGDPPTIVAKRPTEDISFADSLEAYDKRTRGALGRYLGGAGDSLVGRGSDVNEVIAVAPRMFEHLDGAMRTLASSRSGLGRFIQGFARFNEALAPVAQHQAGLFRGLDITFGSMAAVRGDVAAATAEAPPLFDAGIRGMPAQRRMLHATAGLFAALRPGLHALRGEADDIAALSTRSPAAFRSLRSLSPRLADSGRALSRFARDPVVVPALRRLIDTFGALRPTVHSLSASQTVCNYPGVALRNLISVLSEGMSTGNFIGAGAVLVLPGPDGEAGPAAKPADGTKERADNHLHSTLTPGTGEGASPECESGNETYAIAKTVAGHAPGRQPAETEKTVPGRPR